MYVKLVYFIKIQINVLGALTCKQKKNNSICLYDIKFYNFKFHISFLHVLMTRVSYPHRVGYKEYLKGWGSSSPPHCNVFQFKRMGGVANPPYAPSMWAFFITFMNMATVCTKYVSIFYYNDKYGHEMHQICGNFFITLTNMASSLTSVWRVLVDYFMMCYTPPSS